VQINLIGNFYGCLGIPNHTRDLFRAVCEANEDAFIYPLFPEAYQEYDLDVLLRQRTRQLSPNQKLKGVNLIFWTPDIYKNVLYYLDPDSVKICYLIFEWTKFTDEFKKGLEMMDYICVPSESAKQVLIENNINPDKIKIVRAGLHPTFATGLDVPIGEEERDKTRFLMVCKNEKRKCVEEALRCFTEVLGDNDKCVLDALIKDPHDPSFNVRETFKNITAKNINFIDSPNDIGGMEELYISHDFILLPSRSGAVELPLIEAASCGCLPIVTKTSGMSYYLPEDYEYWLQVKEYVKMFDDRWFKPEIDWGLWAEPDWEHFKTLLQSAVQCDAAKLFEQREKVIGFLKSECTYDKIANDLINWIKEETECVK